MLRINSGRCSLMLLLLCGLWSVSVHAETFLYRYVGLDQFVPEGYSNFSTSAIDDSGRVYGTVFDNSDGTAHIVVYADGEMKILQPGYSGAVNKKGTVGGIVLTDLENFDAQAALFRGDKVELVPLLGQSYSFIVDLNDRDTALVDSYDENDAVSYSLYSKGESLLLDLRAGIRDLSFNNKEIITGTVGNPLTNARGMRFDPGTGETTLLNPLPSDLITWSQGINNHGDILGYSFSASRENIGVWDRKGEFNVYFIQGIPRFPTISNRLVFNDKNQIVATNVSSPSAERGNSYLIPKPGVRLNLAKLVENPLFDKKLHYIEAINKQGSMIGLTDEGEYFLLERIRSENN